jgi:hypothetical protein
MHIRTCTPSFLNETCRTKTTHTHVPPSTPITQPLPPPHPHTPILARRCGPADYYNEGYKAMGAALEASGRPIVYSCSWPAYVVDLAWHSLEPWWRVRLHLTPPRRLVPTSHDSYLLSCRISRTPVLDIITGFTVMAVFLSHLHCRNTNGYSKSALTSRQLELVFTDLAHHICVIGTSTDASLDANA